MESLRNFLTGPRLIFIVLLCALPFVFLGTGSLTSIFGGSFGSINGEDVTENDLQLASNTAVQRFKSIYGEEFDFDMLSEEVRSDSIKQELIVQKVLQAEARSLGLFNKNTISEAKKDIVKTPQFQVEGMFNENVYEAQVNSSGYTKESYIDLMANLLASELYRNSLSGINFVTKNELHEIASLLEMTSDISFTKISYQALKDNLVNTSEELLDYYDKNQILFFSDQERQFEYLVLDQIDYKDNVEIPEGYLENAYKDYLSNFDSSAQTRISHIMIDKNNYESTSEAFDQIKKVQDLLINGNDFSDLASEYSEDIVTKENGGDLDYFERDIFPEEFEEGIKNLGLGDFSNIIDLEDTLHIIKVTEINKQEPLSEDQVTDELIDELVELESLALMNDDFSLLEDLILENNSIEEIAEYINKEVSRSNTFTKSNYDFYIDDFAIRDYLFSEDSQINEPFAIELEGKVIVVSISLIVEPKLQPFEKVAEDVADLLSETKAIEKLKLVENEFKTIDSKEDQVDFMKAYDFMSQDTFINVKRYSSLLPQEVLTEIFNNKPNTILNIKANNGDKYIVEINNFNQLSEDEINSVTIEYTNFSQERFSSKMSEIINEDVFESARINLKNVSF
ncbi:MAG: peptidylprolyl isomerase [Gammaproteobacteria bacterium]|nr:peptidylprolyl isomerase [Gammaproteobacteria bacterium]